MVTVALLTLLVDAGCKGSTHQSASKKQPLATSGMGTPGSRPTGPVYRALRQVRVLRGHELGVESLAFSPDGKWLVSGSDDKTVRVWAVATGKLLRTFSAHTAWVPAVAFHPKDALVASGSGDKTIFIQRVNRKTKPIEIKEHAGVNAVAFNPNGTLLAAGSFGGGLRVWHVRSGDWRRTFKGHTSDVLAVAFSPDGTLIASGSADTTVRLWRLATGKQERVLRGHRGAVLSLSFNPAGTILRSVGLAGDLRTWDVRTGKDLRTIQVPGTSIRAADFSPDGTLIALSSGRRIKLLDPRDGKVLRALPEIRKPVTTVVFGPKGRTLAWGSADATIHLWSADAP